MSHPGSSKKISASKKSTLSGKQAAREILLLATSAGLSPEVRERISEIIKGNVDWQYLLDLAEYHEVGPLLSHNLLHNDFAAEVPKTYINKFNTIYHNLLHINIMLADELNKVLTAFNAGNIPVIVLKGIALAEILYNNPGLRVMSDIDIIVPPDMISESKSLLTGLGYQPYETGKAWEHPFHEIPYVKKGQIPVHIELHRNLEDPELVNIPMDEIWRRAQTVRMQGISSLLMSPEDTLLYLSVCFSKPSNFRLKTLGDITGVLKKYDGALDWDYILESARSWQVNVSLGYALKKARSMLGAPVPEAVIQELKPGFFRRLLPGILVNGGTFISPIKWNKLRQETLVLHNGLLRGNFRRMVIVISNFRGHNSRFARLRSMIWILVVFFCALGIKVIRPGDKKAGRIEA